LGIFNKGKDMKFQRLILLGLAALLFAGCQSQNIPDPDADADGTMVDGADGSSTADGFDDDGMGDGEFIDAEFGGEEELTMVIYFDFDQSDLRADPGRIGRPDFDSELRRRAACSIWQRRRGVFAESSCRD
jgi:hypothetical protein